MDDSPPQTRRLRNGLWLALCLTSVGGLLADEGEAVRLAYKFQPNESLHLEYKQDMTMEFRHPDFKHPRKMVSHVVSNKHLRVISVDASGNALVEPVIDRTRMSSRQDDDDESKFDTADDPESCPAQYRPLLATVGRPLVRIQFTPDGKLVRATSLIGDKDVAEDFKKDPTLNFLIVFPDHAVRAGDTWKDDYEAVVQLDKTLKQGVKMRREYRLVKLNDTQAEIELKTACLTPLRDPLVEMQIALRLLTGKIVFDHQRGQIVSREMQVDSQVVNGAGPKTSVSTVMTQSERAVPNPKLAKREP